MKFRKTEQERIIDLMKDPDNFSNYRNYKKFNYIAWPACVFNLQALQKYMTTYHGTDHETVAINKLFSAVRKKIVEAMHPVGRFDEDVKRLLLG